MITQKELSKFITHPKLEKTLQTIAEYNQGMQEITDWKLRNERTYKTDVLNDMVGRKKAEHQTKFITISNDLLKSVSDSLRSENQSLKRELYPMVTSLNGSNIGHERAAGELMLLQARKLIGDGETLNESNLQKLVDEIRLSIDLGRIDFVSYIFDNIGMDGEVKSSEFYNILPELRELEKEFMEMETDGRKIKENIVALKIAVELAREFNRQVIKGTAHALHPMSIEEIKDQKLPKSGVSEELLKRMNESVAFWGAVEKVIS